MYNIPVETDKKNVTSNAYEFPKDDVPFCLRTNRYGIGIKIFLT